MRFAPAALPDAVLAFLAERHLATLTTLRPDGTPHVVPVGFTWDGGAGLARVIADGGSRKVANVRSGGGAVAARPGGARVVLCQVDGRRWLSLEGTATVADAADRVRHAEDLYRARYREPRPNPTRVVIEIRVDRVLGASGLG